MKYRVLLKAVYNVYHEVEAANQKEALDLAEAAQFSTRPRAPGSEFADEVVAAVVDPLDAAGETDYEASETYLAAHHYIYQDMSAPQWRKVGLPR